MLVPTNAILRLSDGRIGHLLHAGDQRCEGGDDDAAWCCAEDLIEGGTDHPFRWCPAGALGIGRIRQQHVHAAGGELRQFGVIGRPVVHRGLIELEVARVNDKSRRSGDGQPDRIRDGVADVEIFDLEWPNLDFPPPGWFELALLGRCVASLTSIRPRVSGVA